MMPSFTLAPWELPPGCCAPLTAPADFVFHFYWQHGYDGHLRETDIYIRAVPQGGALLYFFCDGERPQNGNWVLSIDPAHFPYTDSPWNANALEELFRDNHDLWHDYCGRLVYFDGALYGVPGQHRATISPAGEYCLSWGVDTLAEEKNRKSASVTAPFVDLRAPASAATTKKRLLSQLRNKKSEAHFALHWMHLTPEQQRAKTLHLERGTIEEMEAILRAVLQSQTGIWKSNKPLLWRTQYYESQMSAGSDILFSARTMTAWAPDGTNFLPRRLNDWKRVIWSYFLPTPNEEDQFSYAECVRDFCHSQGGFATFNVEATPPTMHERLEAEFVLREWWQDKFAPLFFETQNTDTPD